MKYIAYICSVFILKTTIIMKKKWNKTVRKATLMLLTVLGIGSSSMLFMACYGTPPRGYQVMEEDSTLVVMEGDSVAATIDLAEDTTKVAE